MPSQFHDHGPHQHSHTHGAVDPALLTSHLGLHAVFWSGIGMLVTALLQLFVVAVSGSVALLADTLHNFTDALTSVPLWLAFNLGRRLPTQRFTYGYGRFEDAAGLVIVGVIVASAGMAGFAAVNRFIHPQSVHHLWAVAVASVIGALGNEAVARLRIKIGKEIGSAALVADGAHARADSLTSAAVLVGAIGVGLGYPLADPIVGLLITFMILGIVWGSSRAVFARLVDAVDPEVVQEIREETEHAPGVLEVKEIRVRWVGHRLHAELNLAVGSGLTVEAGHDIADRVRHDLLHRLPYLSSATIHVDPATRSGEAHHHIAAHQHGALPRHGH